MDRREFLAKAGLVATWAAISVRITGCGDDEGNPLGGGPGDEVGTVSNNHGHSVTITRAAIDAGNAVTLTLTTGQGHQHQLSLDARQVMDVGAGIAVVQQTNPDGTGHSHIVQFN